MATGTGSQQDSRNSVVTNAGQEAHGSVVGVGIAAGHGVLLELEGRVGVAHDALRQHAAELRRVHVCPPHRQQRRLAAQRLCQLRLRRQQRRR